MALTAKQRNALPDKAFAYPKKRKYPVPTKSQAKKAGISEKQRLKIHRNALSRAAQKGTTGAYDTVLKLVHKRSGVSKDKKAKR
jgi:hypothetical protein